VGRTQRFTIDGKTYQSVDDMPPDVKRKWDALQNFVETAFSDAMGDPTRPSGKTTFAFEQTIETNRPDAISPSGSPQGALWRGVFDRRMVSDAEAQSAQDRKVKLISAVFCALFFPVFALAGFLMVSPVNITVHYGPSWIIGYGVYVSALLCSLFLAIKRTAPNEFMRGGRWRIIRLCGGLVGLASFTAFAIFGGVPTLAHHLTARPGELIVTVSAKDPSYKTGRCRRRLKVDEFTFFLNNRLCPDEETFNAIGVGTKLKLTGKVSRFGIDPDRMYWLNSH
jgi:hypothetical protein